MENPIAVLLFVALMAALLFVAANSFAALLSRQERRSCWRRVFRGAFASIALFVAFGFAEGAHKKSETHPVDLAIESDLESGVTLTEQDLSSQEVDNIDPLVKESLRLNAIACADILSPLWDDLHRISTHPEFVSSAMASGVYKQWEERVQAAQAADFPSDKSWKEVHEISQCVHDFSIIGAKSPYFFMPIELRDAAYAFSDRLVSDVSRLKRKQIEEWLVWANSLR